MGSLLLESLDLCDSLSSSRMSSTSAEMAMIDSQSRSDNLDEYLCVVSSCQRSREGWVNKSAGKSETLENEVDIPFGCGSSSSISDSTKGAPTDSFTSA